jgi:hypothetical protein
MEFLFINGIPGGATQLHTILRYSYHSNHILTGTELEEQ